MNVDHTFRMVLIIGCLVVIPIAPHERNRNRAVGAASYRFAFSFDEYTKKDCFFSPLLVHEAGKDAGSRRRRDGD